MTADAIAPDIRRVADSLRGITDAKDAVKAGQRAGFDLEATNLRDGTIKPVKDALSTIAKSPDPVRVVRLAVASLDGIANRIDPAGAHGARKGGGT